MKASKPKAKSKPHRPRGTATVTTQRLTPRERSAAAHRAKFQKEIPPASLSAPAPIQWRTMEEGRNLGLRDEVVILTGGNGFLVGVGEFKHAALDRTHYILGADLLKLPRSNWVNSFGAWAHKALDGQTFQNEERGHSPAPQPLAQPLNYDALSSTIQHAVTQGVLEANRQIESKTLRHRFHPTPIPGYPFSW